jgi:1-phosphofructokinase family hexose kinase
MIVTVTLNTGIDRTVFIPAFEYNKTIRATRLVIGMGAKATDASWVLGELDIPNLALGFAAGMTGRLMESMLQARGVTTSFTWVDGDTRTNAIITCEDVAGQTTITSNSLIVSPAHIEALRRRYDDALAGASCVIIGGSIPEGVDPNLCKELVSAGRSKDIPVVFDASGQALAHGILGRPTIIKPNRAELSELYGPVGADLAEIYRAARRLQEAHGCMVLVTLGAQGALAVCGDQAYRIHIPQVQVVSPAGAGDAVLAGLASAFSEGKPVLDGLRLGFAAATAVLLTPATADCRKEDVYHFLDKIEITPYQVT